MKAGSHSTELCQQPGQGLGADMRDTWSLSLASQQMGNTEALLLMGSSWDAQCGAPPNLKQHLLVPPAARSSPSPPPCQEKFLK